VRVNHGAANGALRGGLSKYGGGGQEEKEAEKKHQQQPRRTATCEFLHGCESPETTLKRTDKRAKFMNLMPGELPLWALAPALLRLAGTAVQVLCQGDLRVQL
jgi:hypothetical protein